MDSTIIAAIIGAIAVIVAAIIGIIGALKHESKQKQKEVYRGQRPKRARYFFLVGCGIGNPNMLLPSSSLKSKVIKMDEFINALERIGFQDNPLIEPIFRARDILESQDPDILPYMREDAKWRMVDTTSKLPDILQAMCSPDEFQWFKFGQLLYMVVSSVVLNLIFVKKMLSDEERKKLGGTSSTMSTITALESLSESLNLHSSIRQEVNKFIQVAMNRAYPWELQQNADQIAQAMLLLL